METRSKAMLDWERLRKEIVQELTPSDEEKIQLLAFAKQAVVKINRVLKTSGIDAKAQYHGSVAHGTWISGQQDLDIFIIIEKHDGREQLQHVLDTVREKTEWDFTEAYAEHPYLKTQVNGYSLDIVPCFRVTAGESLYSSTDRTPLHTKWLTGRIEDLVDDVRLLKQFLMVLGLYGAEIKIGGFSGYLCELLIVYYGGFWELIEAASRWGKKESISFFENPKRFTDPLTFIDPIDHSRNVASALREESYSLFIAAARSFIKKPSTAFFKKERIDVSPEMILGDLHKRATDILFLVIEESRADNADVLWGQIHKSRRALELQINKNGFEVLRSTAWSNEETRHIFVYELTSEKVPEAVKHLGPPAHLESNVQQFIESYKDNPKTIAGPDLLGDRWYVLIKRNYTNIRDLMDFLLSDGGRNVGVSKKLSVKILQHHRILVNEEIKDYLFDGFEYYFYDWLKGRPLWIE